MLLPIILSGGSGSRLWPVSREQFPKQFQRLSSSEESLLQETVQRLAHLPGCAPPLVICNDQHRFLVADQLLSIGVSPTGILLEPIGRNTAPALALAAMAALGQHEDPVLLAMPADHVIRDGSAFASAVNQGLALIDAGQLVTFGIEPTHAHTGYGYIRCGAPLGSGHRVSAFVEKPDAGLAAQYLASGEYLWNSGIFLMRARHYLEELSRHAPDVLFACEAAFEGRAVDLDFMRIDAERFASCPDISIDYAVMERTQSAAVVPMSPGWSDIGSWDAVHALHADAEADGNATHGDVVLADTSNCLVRSESRLVAALGVQDLVIVETDDAVLVAHQSHAQKTREVVDILKAGKRSEPQMHRCVYRPWGHYRSVASDTGFQVKQIVVKPGAQLSLQMHHHRSEHWVVVAGTAKVTLGEGYGEVANLKSFLLGEDESTYIPQGTVHRLENPGLIPLRLIEVQTGDYLGEDDIVRFDDAYGRSSTEPTKPSLHGDH